VLDDIAVTARPVIPARLRAAVDAEFGGLGDFLREVQVRWYRAFNARLDDLLEEQPRDLHAALVQLWHDLADTMPTARYLLDSHLDHPKLAAGDARHRSLLHTVTGVDLDPASLPRRSLPMPPSPRCPLLKRAGRRTGHRWPSATARHQTLS
jgi:hypothetical protein